MICAKISLELQNPTGVFLLSERNVGQFEEHFLFIMMFN